MFSVTVSELNSAAFGADFTRPFDPIEALRYGAAGKLRTLR
jgi:hypothetical protein